MKPALAPQRKAQARPNSSGVAEAAGGIELGPFREHRVHGGATLFRFRLGDRATQAVGVERTRQQGVDGDIVDHGFARNTGDKASEAGSRAIGQPQHLDWRLYRGGGDVDDAAEFSRHHAIDGRLDQFDRGEHVGIDRLDPVVAGPVAEIAGWRAAGIVDQDIRIGTGLERSLAARRRGDVAGDFRHRDAGMQLRISAAVFASASAPRAVRVTCTPSPASAMAQARPKPLLDAHTIARRPLIPRSTVSLPSVQMIFCTPDTAILAKAAGSDKRPEQGTSARPKCISGQRQRSADGRIREPLYPLLSLQAGRSWPRLRWQGPKTFLPGLRQQRSQLRPVRGMPAGGPLARADRKSPPA